MLTTLCFLVAATSACRDGAVTSTVIQEGVAITPPSTQVSVGATVQLSAQLFDEDGSVVPNTTFTWWTPDASIATVDASGMVSALELGAVTIAAITADQSSTGFADITVISSAGEGGGGEGGGGEGGGGSGGGGGGGNSPSVLNIPADHSAAGPNEPAGMTPSGILDFSTGSLVFVKTDIFNRSVYNFDGADIRGGSVSLVQDQQQGQVLEFRFPTGCMNGGGHSCGNKMVGLTANYRTQYMRADVWLSPNYWVNPSGNKFIGALGGVAADDASAGTYHIKPTPQSGQSPNFGPNVPMIWNVSEGGGHCPSTVSRNNYTSKVVPRGQWMTIEHEITASSAPCAPDGRIRTWVDGQLIQDAQNVPTWDPNGAPHSGAQYYRGILSSPIMGGVCTASSIQPCPTPGHAIRFKRFYVSGR